MVARELNPELKNVDEWIALCQELSPVETYCLIGLLADRPELPPGLTERLMKIITLAGLSARASHGHFSHHISKEEARYRSQHFR